MFMNGAYILVIVIMFPAVPFAQPPALSELPNQTFAFQRAGSLGVDVGARGVSVPMLRADTGRPFSATVRTQTTQTYLDGTHVSQTTVMPRGARGLRPNRAYSPDRGRAY